VAERQEVWPTPATRRWAAAADRLLADGGRLARIEARGPGEITVSHEVDAPPERVFNAATDWVGQSEWIPLTRVRLLSGDGRSVGSVVGAFSGLGRVGFLDVVVVTRWDPPHEVGVLHAGRLVRGPGSFRFEALPGGGTRFVWTEWLHLPLGRVGALGWTLVRPVFAFGLRQSLVLFGRWAQRRPASVVR